LVAVAVFFDGIDCVAGIPIFLVSVGKVEGYSRSCLCRKNKNVQKATDYNDIMTVLLLYKPEYDEEEKLIK